MAKALDVGPNHACVWFGEMRCWGSGVSGKLGYGNLENIGDDEPPSAAGSVNTGWESSPLISAGGYHSCVVRGQYRNVVKCWGGMLGDNEEPASIPSILLDTDVVGIDSGGIHACVLLTGGGVRCWGDGLNGALGYGVTTGYPITEGPVNVGNVSLGGPAIQVATGSSHSCALMQDGAVRCWGFNLFGQLGLGNTTMLGDNELPTSVGPIDLGAPALQVSAGNYHTCALLEGGDVRCWGEGDDGRLGLGNTNDIGDDELPTAVPVIDLGGPAVQVSAGYVHTCALLETGAVRCWGAAVLNGTEDQMIGDDELPSAGPYVDVI